MYDINPEIFDHYIMTHFPKLYGMIGIHTIKYDRNINKFARFVHYEYKRYDGSLTTGKLLSYMVDHPEIYEYKML